MGRIDELSNPILTPNAIKVLEKRYLEKDNLGNVIQTPKELFFKVASVVANTEKDEQARQEWATVYYNMMAKGQFFPNSPALMNPEGQKFACFTLAVEDSIEEIFNTLSDSALLFQSGGGVGINFSNIRPKGSIVGQNSGVACLTGDTILIRENKESVPKQKITILDLYALKTAGRIMPKNIRCMVDDGLLGTNRIKDVIDNGVSTIFEVITKNNYRIKATSDHRFLTENGWKKLSEFNLGDKIAVNGLEKVPEKCSRCNKVRLLRSTRSKYSGLCENCVVSVFHGCSIEGSDEHKRRIIERGIKLKDYRLKNRDYFSQINSGAKNPGWKGDAASPTTARQRIAYLYPLLKKVSICSRCGLEGVRIEIHHKDGNCYLNELANLECLCSKCHRNEHASRMAKGNYRLTKEILFEEITSITNVGTDRVYDIVMEAPYHNFIANGFVSHNSGPCSFMHVYNSMAEHIKQGGKRRGGFMGMLDIEHPDILEFIRVKDDLSLLTNFNLSVAISKEFEEDYKRKPDEYHIVKFGGSSQPLVGPSGMSISRRKLIEMITESAWRTGEPALAFVDRAEADNKVKHVGRITTYNLCGELPLICNGSCVLGSINISKFVSGPRLDEEALKIVVRHATRFLDSLIDTNVFPLAKIEDMTLGNRSIGLGQMGMATALFKLGIPYDSERGVDFAANSMRIIQDTAIEYSSCLAETRGVFPNWEGSEWHTQNKRMRNAAVTMCAPTGSLSYFADCSAGIEPLFSLAFQRNVMDGTIMREVSQEFLTALKDNKIELSDDQWSELYNEDGFISSIQHVDFLPKELKSVFVCAHDISPEWHLKVQEACQNFCCSAISKTINFPHDATIEDVNKVFIKTLTDSNVKGITVYRDGCRANQPMSTKSVESKPDKQGILKVEIKQGLVLQNVPDMIPAVKLTQATPLGKLHISLSVLPDQDKEIELFSQLGKSGDIILADLEAICRLASRLLRFGDKLEDIVAQLKGIGSSTMVPTFEGSVSSLPDGIAKALERYLAAKKAKGLISLLVNGVDLDETINKDNNLQLTTTNILKLKCPICSAVLSKAEGCIHCEACGYSAC